MASVASIVVAKSSRRAARLFKVVFFIMISLIWNRAAGCSVERPYARASMR